MSFLGIKPKRLLKWRGILAMLMFALGVIGIGLYFGGYKRAGGNDDAQYFYFISLLIVSPFISFCGYVLKQPEIYVFSAGIVFWIAANVIAIAVRLKAYVNQFPDDTDVVLQFVGIILGLISLFGSFLAFPTKAKKLNVRSVVLGSIVAAVGVVGVVLAAVDQNENSGGRDSAVILTYQAGFVIALFLLAMINRSPLAQTGCLFGAGIVMAYSLPFALPGSVYYMPGYDPNDKQKAAYSIIWADMILIMIAVMSSIKSDGKTE